MSEILPTGIAPIIQMDEWFELAVDPDKVTIEAFDKFVDEYLSECEKADSIDAVLTEQNKKVAAMQGKLMEYLDVMGKKKHVTARGTISKIETSTYKPPEGENRETMLQYLRDNGKYDNVMAFNAAKFSSWYKTELEANSSFKFEGVEQKTNKYIRFNKG